jgi:hypothetical protein
VDEPISTVFLAAAALQGKNLRERKKQTVLVDGPNEPT